jgi:hypothetical protein
MPQDTSVCVYQAGSLPDQSPTPVGTGSASLHIAENITAAMEPQPRCIACRRAIRSGDDWVHVQLDTHDHQALAQMHAQCALDWERSLHYVMTTVAAL